MPVEMISQSSHLGPVAFYVLVGLIIAAAVGAVTISDARRTAFSFVCLSVLLAVALTFEVSPVTGLAAIIPGLVVGALYWRSETGSANLPVADPEMEDGPNRPVALFIALSLLLILTPVWINSMWKGHAVTALEHIPDAVFSSLTGKNSAEFGAILALASGVAVALFVSGRATDESAPDGGVDEPEAESFQ